jgi:hypothetical protein
MALEFWELFVSAERRDQIQEARRASTIVAGAQASLRAQPPVNPSKNIAPLRQEWWTARHPKPLITSGSQEHLCPIRVTD